MQPKTILAFATLSLAAPALSSQSERAGAHLFAAPQTEQIGRADRIALGDWDGDGWIDAVCLEVAGAFVGDDAFLVLRNERSGRFERTDSATLAGAPSDVLLHDFDGDGCEEALLCIPETQELVLVQGACGLSGLALTPVQLGLEPHSLGLGDLNGDGHADLLLGTLSATGPTMELFLSGPEGGFLGRTSIALPVVPTDIELFDTDRDGRDEVFFFEAPDNLSPPDTGFYTLDASLAPTRFEAGGFVHHLTTVDLDRDGLFELLVSGSAVTSWERDAGTFVEREVYPVATGAFPTSRTSSVVADFDADGQRELLVSAQSGTHLLPEDTSGMSFASGERLLPLGNARLHVADLDRNGSPDIAHRSISAVESWLASPNGLELPLSVATDHGGEVELHDLDGDGRLEVVAIATFEDAIHVWTGTSEAGFSLASELPTGRTPSTLAVQDMDGDGRLDIAVIEQDGDNVLVWKNEGSLQFSLLSSTRFVFPFCLEAGDLDGDGRADLAFGGIGRFAVRLSGTSSVATTNVSGSVDDIVFGDVDGDGHLDAVMGVDDQTQLRRGRGDGSFEPGELLQPSPGAQTNYQTLGDWNRDGTLDLLTTGGATSSNEGVVLALGRGDGSFDPATVLAGGRNLVRARGGDLDLDGWSDVVFGRNDDAVVVRNLGQGRMAEPRAFGLATSASGERSLALGDLSGDGVLDIVTLPFTVSIGRGVGLGQTFTRTDARTSPSIDVTARRAPR